MPAFMFLAAAIRLPFVLLVGPGVNADEAWTGLMAFSILRGEYPVFMPGLGYMGSIEAYATAVLFHLFGSSARLMYVVPTAVSILLVPLAGRLGRDVAGERGEMLAGVFMAAAPAFLVVFGNAPRLGYVETLLWGLVLFAAAARLIECSPGRERTLLLVSGFVAGLAAWTNLLIAPFVASAAAAMAVFRWRMIASRKMGWALVGFAVGSLPFWIFNVRHDFWSFALMEAGERGELAAKAATLAGETLPFVLGMRDVSTGDWLPPAAALLGAGYAAAFAGWLMKRDRPHAARRRAPLLPLALLAFTLLAYMASRYGNLASPRYLFPVYGALPILLAGVISAAWGRSRAWLLVVSLILAGNLVGVARAYQDFSTPGSGESEVPSLKPVLDLLSAEGMDRLYADYGVSVRLNFETGGRVIASQPSDERYAPFAAIAAEAPRVAIAGVGRFTFFDPADLSAQLRGMGFAFKESTVGGWRVYWGFELSGAGSSAISPRLWRAESSGGPLGPLGAGGAFDRDVTTRWGSGRPRGEGIWYRLDLGRVETVHRVILLPGVFTTDHPAGLRVEASVDGRVWGVVWERRGLMPGLYVSGGQPRFDSSGVVEARFSPVGARYLKFTHLGEAPPFDWSIGEVFVYAPVSAERGVRREGVVSMAGRLVTLGRTAEARERLSCVLAFDPENADAHRLHSLALKAGE